jgi:hypothetical protein
MPEARLVDVFIGGVQKSGTTTLHAYLAGHPGLLTGQGKELHFFDDETIDWATPDYARLLRNFDTDPADSADRRRLVDATPIYLFWPPALQRIVTYNSHARHIYIFRDPIERAWSHWRMETRRNAETLPFSAAIRQGRWRLSSIPSTDDAWRVYSYVERGFYGTQLRRMFTLVPRSNVLLLRSNDLQLRPQATLGKVADFLGLAPFTLDGPRTDHEAPIDAHRLQPNDIAYLRNVFFDEVREFSHLSGLLVDDWLTMANGTA